MCHPPPLPSAPQCHAPMLGLVLCPLSLVSSPALLGSRVRRSSSPASPLFISHHHQAPQSSQSSLLVISHCHHPYDDVCHLVCTAWPSASRSVDAPASGSPCSSPAPSRSFLQFSRELLLLSVCARALLPRLPRRPSPCPRPSPAPSPNSPPRRTFQLIMCPRPCVSTFRHRVAVFLLGRCASLHARRLWLMSDTPFRCLLVHLDRYRRILQAGAMWFRVYETKIGESAIECGNRHSLEVTFDVTPSSLTSQLLWQRSYSTNQRRRRSFASQLEGNSFLVQPIRNTFML